MFIISSTRTEVIALDLVVKYKSYFNNDQQALKVNSMAAVKSLQLDISICIELYEILNRIETAVCKLARGFNSLHRDIIYCKADFVKYR